MQSPSIPFSFHPLEKLEKSHRDRRVENSSPPLEKPDEREDEESTGGGDTTDFTSIGPILKMTQSVYREILDDLTEKTFSKEKAGMLLGPSAEDDLVTHYIPDKTGRATYSSFTLDAESLNRRLLNYQNVGMDCKGIVHVHPPGILRPSFGDLQYVAKLFANPKNEQTTQVMLPIACNGRLYPYLIDADDPQEILVPNLILV